MAFDVAGNAYLRFMGRFSEKLSAPFADFAGVDAGSGMGVVDVGCGPGALTAVLVDRLGASAVTGADPSEPFAYAVPALERLCASLGGEVRRTGPEFVLSIPLMQEG